jgi:hypothetical protein
MRHHVDTAGENKARCGAEYDVPNIVFDHALREAMQLPGHDRSSMTTKRISAGQLHRKRAVQR